jgi:hypothetical protein
MNYENARTALATLVTQALVDYPNLKVFWDNSGPLDLSVVKDTCLEVDYYWDDAGQASLGDAPLVRTTGSVYLTIYAKAGTGTKSCLQLMDTLTDRLKFRNSEGLVTTVPRPGRRQERDGWQSQELHLPFRYDSV